MLTANAAIKLGQFGAATQVLNSVVHGEGYLQSEATTVAPRCLAGAGARTQSDTCACYSITAPSDDRWPARADLSHGGLL